MINETRIPAKATTPDEQSDSIVVSFGAEWHPHLLSEAFSVVIRRRIPKNRSYSWLYFHINRPIGAICGRARIESILTITKEETIALALQIHLSTPEINFYVGTASKIGCYTLGTFEFGKEIASTAQLSTKIKYYPPQNFFILSKQAKDIVDHFCGFTSSKVAKSLWEAKL